MEGLKRLSCRRSALTTTRSMTFSSSRTLPGHEYSVRMATASAEISSDLRFNITSHSRSVSPSASLQEVIDEWRGCPLGRIT